MKLEDKVEIARELRFSRFAVPFQPDEVELLVGEGAEKGYQGYEVCNAVHWWVRGGYRDYGEEEVVVGFPLVQVEKGGEGCIQIVSKGEKKRRKVERQKKIIKREGVSPMKVTKEMIAGTEPIPEGYELKDIEHKEYSFINKQGKEVTVKAHTEHVLAQKKVEKPKAEKKTEKPKK